MAQGGLIFLWQAGTGPTALNATKRHYKLPTDTFLDPHVLRMQKWDAFATPNTPKKPPLPRRTT